MTGTLDHGNESSLAGVLRRGFFALAMTLGPLQTGAVQAQGTGYPDKEVHVTVPFAAGGTADLVARIVTDGLSQRLGQSFLIENKPGAGGVVGAGQIAKFKPDGYGLGVGSVSSHATSASLRKDLPYDPQKDFTPIARLAGVPNVMVVNAALPVKSVDDFIAYAKEHPDELNFGSIGNGTSQHLGAELFKIKTGVEMVHVPYSDNGLMIADLVNGKIHVVFDNLPNMLGQMQAGTVRALGVTTEERWPKLPDLPTLEEQGVEDFNISSWLGLFGPAGLADDQVERLNAEINAILETPATSEKLLEAGTLPMPGTPGDLASHVESEIERWRGVVEASGLAPH